MAACSGAAGTWPAWRRRQPACKLWSAVALASQPASWKLASSRQQAVATHQIVSKLEAARRRHRRHDDHRGREAAAVACRPR